MTTGELPTLPTPNAVRELSAAQAVALAERMNPAPAPNPPHKVTEYGIAERVKGDLRLLPTCGSFYTDRYYLNDLTGRDAAQAAADRVAATVPGSYEIVEVRTFLRAHDAGLTDALTDTELREYLRLRTTPDQLDFWVEQFRGSTLSQMEAHTAAIHCEGDAPGECQGHALPNADEPVYCDGTCRC